MFGGFGKIDVEIKKSVVLLLVMKLNFVHCYTERTTQ